MAEIAPQRIGEFLRIVFLRLWQESAGLPVGETLAQIPQTTVLTDFEMEYIPSTHTPRYERTVRLATIPYVHAGWLVKNKGRWILTDEGKQACKSFTNAEAFIKNPNGFLRNGVGTVPSFRLLQRKPRKMPGDKSALTSWK